MGYDDLGREDKFATHLKQAGRHIMEDAGIWAVVDAIDNSLDLIQEEIRIAQDADTARILLKLGCEFLA